jgi:hypothetical protein
VATRPDGTIAPVAAVSADAGSGSPSGYTPQQIRAAYGFGQITFGSIAGDGAGQTIAIVDAYDDPGLVDSSTANFGTSDLAQFDRQFGLPDPPSFTKLNEAGNPSPMPGTDPAGPGSTGGQWEYEEAMDVEWAHALAPAASIVLVEANSNGNSDLYTAIGVADHLAGVSVVSLSWGGPEFSSEASSDQSLQTPGGHQGVTFVASSGDAGAPGNYPAFSKNVLAVGGTALQLNADGSIQSETAWSGSGGGISADESEPSYQKGVQSTGHRTIPDAAFDASSSTGVSVYDSYDNTGGGPWVTMWGTSLGAPAWAALVTVADQGRVAAGGTTLDGPSQTLPALYSLASADFHDITSGGNGSFNASSGYDEVAGLGTPVANLLAPGLAFYGMSDHLAITAQPGSSITAGQPFGLTVEVERPDGSLDAAATGTLTISIANQPGGASLGGTLSASIDHGIATFAGLAIDQAGSGYSLAVSGGGFGSATSSSFTVAPAAASELVVAAQPPSSLTAGSPFGLTIEVEDAFGNPVAVNPGGVTLSLVGGPAGGSLAGGLETGVSGGVASFSGLSIDQAGTGYAIVATAAGLAPATTGSFGVTPAAPAQLIIESGPPSSVTAGGRFGVTVSVEDAFGNVETGNGGDVTVSLVGGPAGAVLGGATTEPAVSGVATFSGLELTRAGSGYAIEASIGSLAVARSGAFDVTPSAPAQLAFSQQPPTTIAAGSPFNLGVSVEDAFGNPVSSSRSPISLSLLGGPTDASLGGTATASAASGVATFDGLTLGRVGSPYRIQASSPGLSGATTDELSVTPAAPAQLVMTLQPPASVTAGSAFGLGVSVEDALGNLVTGYGGDVTLALERGPAGSSLSGTLSATVSQGVASFSGLTINQAAGDFALKVAANGVGSVSTSSFRVVPAAPSQLVIIDQPPSRTVAGQEFGFTAAVEDQFGNVATGFSGPVTASLANDPAGGSLSGPVVSDAVNGIATFNGLTVDQAGVDYAIEAASGGLNSSSLTSISVAPAAASRLIITARPPSTVGANRSFAVGVEAVDPYGNLATGFDGIVTAALAANPHHNTVRGSLSVQANGGEAIITGARLNKTGKSYAITITSSGLTPAVTSVFDVTRPAAVGGLAALRPISRFALRHLSNAMGHSTKMTHDRAAGRPVLRADRGPHSRR